MLCIVLSAAIICALWPIATPAAQADIICAGREILFVAGSRPLPAQDESLRLYLIALGQIVTVREGSEVTTDDAKGKSLIIISESVESETVNTKFRDVGIPILTWEGWLQDDLGMTAAGQTDGNQAPTVAALNVPAQAAVVQDKDEGSYGENLGQTRIEISNPNHPLAAGYSGPVTTVRNRTNKFHWGVPNSNATIVAHEIDMPNHAMIYAYEDGTKMVDLTAPARRVFIHNATAPNLTNEGLAIFLNAVYWAMGCLDNPVTPTATATATATVVPETATATMSPSMTTTPTNVPTMTPTATSATIPTVTVTATPMATATATPTATPTVTPTATPTSTLQPTATPDVDELTIKKDDLLFIDADEDGVVSAGDTLIYLIQLRNHGNQTFQNLLLEDRPDRNTRLLPGTVQASAGTISSGNQSGNTLVNVTIATLAPQSTVQISFQVEIEQQSNAFVLTNQATLRLADSSGSPGGQRQIASDDPNTAAPDDATLTPLGSNPTRTLYLPLVTR
ncbi:MAG: hypothetical protein R2867_00070 [Caldilineaceae bacterium]